MWASCFPCGEHRPSEEISVPPGTAASTQLAPGLSKLEVGRPEDLLSPPSFHRVESSLRGHRAPAGSQGPCGWQDQGQKPGPLPPHCPSFSSACNPACALASRRKWPRGEASRTNESSAAYSHITSRVRAVDSNHPDQAGTSRSQRQKDDLLCPGEKLPKSFL